MPKLSAFTPCGLLRMSAKKSTAETIYRSMVANAGSSFDLTKGTRQEATIYAQAMGLARTRGALTKAGGQGLAATTSDMLGAVESEYGIVPGPTDTMADRRGVLAARKKLPGGGSRVQIENALRDALGSDFLAYVPTATADAVLWPAALGDAPMNLQPATVARKLITITQPILPSASAQLVHYELQAIPTDLSPTAPTLDLAVGDALVVQPENDGLAEVVTIATVNTGSFFSAIFTNPHDTGCSATTMPYPRWESTKRHSLIVLTASAAADSEKRRKVHEVMERMARAVSTWSITDGASGSTLGPFKVEESKLDITTIEAVSY